MLSIVCIASCSPAANHIYDKDCMTDLSCLSFCSSLGPSIKDSTCKHWQQAVSGTCQHELWRTTQRQQQCLVRLFGTRNYETLQQTSHNCSCKQFKQHKHEPSCMSVFAPSHIRHGSSRNCTAHKVRCKQIDMSTYLSGSLQYCSYNNDEAGRG